MITKEEYYGIYTSDEINKKVKSGSFICLRGKRPVLIGKECLLKVNTNIGVSNIGGYEAELLKIKELISCEYRPDTIMDDSVIELKKPLWRTLLEDFDGAVGVIPYYTIFNEQTGIAEDALINNIKEMASSGVSFMTLHPTADIGLYRKAVDSKRKIPMTSRGGYALIKDQSINGRAKNIIAENFEYIMGIFKAYGVCVSIGSAFRPGTIHDALDDIHIEEINMQKEFIKKAKGLGVSVIMEGVGHISLDKIPIYAELIGDHGAPLMPLGPLPTDEAVGFDHIANSIGALAMAQCGVVGIINSITREEHTGDVPSLNSVIEGLKTAAVTAHSYNMSRFPTYSRETEMTGIRRGRNCNCAVLGGIFQFSNDNSSDICNRCERECPLSGVTSCRPIIKYGG